MSRKWVAPNERFSTNQGQSRGIFPMAQFWCFFGFLHNTTENMERAYRYWAVRSNRNCNNHINALNEHEAILTRQTAPGPMKERADIAFNFPGPKKRLAGSHCSYIYITKAKSSTDRKNHSTKLMLLFSVWLSRLVWDQVCQNSSAWQESKLAGPCPKQHQRIRWKGTGSREGQCKNTTKVWGSHTSVRTIDYVTTSDEITTFWRIYRSNKRLRRAYGATEKREPNGVLAGTL